MVAYAEALIKQSLTRKTVKRNEGAIAHLPLEDGEGAEVEEEEG
jgi:hypothetical protein